VIKCEVCHREFKNYIGLSTHIRKTYNVNSKEYYDKYLKKENEGICLECGKGTNYINLSKGYNKFCSKKCVSISSIIKNKRESTNIKKYGNVCSLQNKEVKEKAKKTIIEKYGVENPSQKKKIRKKQKETCLRKYGTEYPSQNDKIKEKRDKTFLEKYNGHPLKNKEVVERMKKTNTNKFIPILNKQLEYLNIKLIDKKYIDSHFKHNWKCLNCNIEFNQIWNEIQQGFTCPKCFPRNKSNVEIELLEFIKSIESLEIIENSREIIPPYELDIFIPSKNIAIEFDGLYWHSEKNIDDKNYHLNKTELCQFQNIQLIHIFEDEWIFKQDIVKSRLKQILSLNTSERIHARKCEIKEIDPKIKNEFLDKYHIQGKDNSNIKLGAFCDDELISVMTFSKGNISKGSKNIENIYELNRFCSNSNYHIPGIVSKLLIYFKKNYEWKEIFSYVDRRWSNGNIYFKIGFELDHITKPNYFYIKNGIRVHRFNLRKRQDEPKDIPECILRSKEGYFRIWDCGYYKFKIDNNID